MSTASVHFRRQGEATRTAPRVPQTTAGVVGTPLSVTATQHEDGTVTVTMDAGTASTVVATLGRMAVEQDAMFRRTGVDWIGSNAVRARTVTDAVYDARYNAGLRTVTFDVD